MDLGQHKESRKAEFIENPKKAMWKLSIPMMLGMSVQAIYMLVDTAFIGQWVGAEGLAALGYVFPFMFIVMGITFGLGSGVTALIAQHIGAENKKSADNTAEHSVLLGFGIALLLIGLVTLCTSTTLCCPSASNVTRMSSCNSFALRKMLLIAEP